MSIEPSEERRAATVADFVQVVEGYSKKDINLIKKIKELMDKGFTLKSAVQQMRLSKLGIPCLPIHDSYIVAADYEELLWQVMSEEYKNLLRYEPVIEKKD